MLPHRFPVPRVIINESCSALLSVWPATELKKPQDASYQGASFLPLSCSLIPSDPVLSSSGSSPFLYDLQWWLVHIPLSAKVDINHMLQDLLTKLWPSQPSFFVFFCLCLHHMTCGISVSQPGIEPQPWQWKPGILTTRPPGNSPALYF